MNKTVANTVAEPGAKNQITVAITVAVYQRPKNNNDAFNASPNFFNNNPSLKQQINNKPKIMNSKLFQIIALKVIALNK